MAAAANVSHPTDRDKNDPPDRSGGVSADKEAAAGTSAAVPATTDGTSGTEQVDRDALHQADYGGSREPAGIPDVASPGDMQQGGESSDEAAGGGRKPTGDRDRDYDPDGDRAEV